MYSVLCALRWKYIYGGMESQKVEKIPSNQQTNIPSPRSLLNKLLESSFEVNEFEPPIAQLCYLSDPYPCKSYEPLYSASCRLNSIIAFFLLGWLTPLKKKKDDRKKERTHTHINIFLWVCVFLDKWLYQWIDTQTHTHTHTHIYIYIYV